MRTVLIEMEKLKNRNSGLGQFCLNLGEHMATQLNSTTAIDLYVPKTAINIFGKSFNYVQHKAIHKLTGASKKPYTVWHCMHQGSTYLPPLKKTKLILTIHDLNFLEKYTGLKKQLKLRQLQQKANRTDFFTFISEYTQQVAQQHLELYNKPTAIIYNGNSLKLFPEAIKPNFVGECKFLFTIGIIAAKKNFHVLLPFIQKLKNYKLIIAGNNTSAYAAYILQQAKELGIAEQVILPGIVSDQEKYWLYQHAEAFVFPSLTEGFGLPIIEAMSLGKPVFISALSSLPEIGGPHAYYWKDFNSENMCATFLNGMKDYNSNPLKMEQIKSWTLRFSWKNAAQQYLAIYEQFNYLF